MQFRVWPVALAVAFVCGTAGAQNVLPQSGPQAVLTEADAIAKLSTDSPRVRAIRSGITLARADMLAASRWPNPRLYVGRESVAGVSETITTDGLTSSA